VTCTDQITLPVDPTAEISAILCTQSSISKPIALAGLDNCGVAIFLSRCQKAQGIFNFVFTVLRNWVMVYYRSSLIFLKLLKTKASGRPQ